MASFQAGDTFFVRDKVGTDKGHLYVVLCAPYGKPLLVLALRFNTAQYDSDNTLILHPGDHPFINRPTVVSFHSLKKLEVEKLLHLERLNMPDMFERKAPVSSELLERIIEGAKKSEDTPELILAELKVQLGLKE